ncbi:MAG TPA: hypothetical protein QKA37_04875 [Candidatus Megaira endosymbiont of Stentor roeselii]|nr:hypothetical protein [Candidatus Megaera endosymbiont of Stentor roeselii]
MQKKLLKKTISTSRSKTKREKVNKAALQQPLLPINQSGFIFLRDLKKFGFKKNDLKKILSSIKDAYLKGRISCGLWYIEENSKDYISLDESSFKSILDTDWGSYNWELYKKYLDPISKKDSEVINDRIQGGIIAFLVHNSVIHIIDLIKILNSKALKNNSNLFNSLVSTRMENTYKFRRNKIIIESYLAMKGYYPKTSNTEFAKVMLDIIERLPKGKEINKLKSKEELSALQDKMCREIKWKAGIKDNINADTVGKFESIESIV